MFRHSHARPHHQMLSSPSKLKATRDWHKSQVVFSSMHSSVLPCVRCAAWGLLLACVVVFWSITFARPTGWYRDDKGSHFRAVWDTLELQSKAGQEQGRKPIMQGMISTQARHCTQLTDQQLVRLHAPEQLHEL